MGIAAPANVLAEKLSDDDIHLLTAVLSQLGDTLTTFSDQRGICDDKLVSTP